MCILLAAVHDLDPDDAPACLRPAPCTRSLLQMQGCLDEDVARMYVAETVLALEYCHSQVGAAGGTSGGKHVYVLSCAPRHALMLARVFSGLRGAAHRGPSRSASGSQHS